MLKIIKPKKYNAKDSETHKNVMLKILKHSKKF